MILVVPAREPGRGGGHLVRCTKLVNELQALGKDAILHDPIRDNPCNPWANLKLIILDKFQTSANELTKWKELAPVIGIDEGGTCRDEFDFLIDILPNLEKINSNISDISLLPLPKKPLSEGTEPRSSQRRILISFGMEDSAGLGKAVFDSLLKEENDNLDITFLNKENQIPNLAEHLQEFDLVITHFGNTAFEAIYAGTPVALINPTSYHEKLSRKAGFETIKKSPCSLSLCDLRENKFPKFLPKSLAQLIASFEPQIHRACPVCGEPAPKRAQARFSDRTYRKCKKCGIIFMDRLTPAPITYGKEYFFEDYKKQYGKTYLEDFPNLVAMAKQRIKRIASRKDAKTQRLLDIGCAYGAFLSAARDEGFESYGIDPCKEAVDYVQNTLGLQATCSTFPIPSDNRPATCYLLPVTCITLWFTIEHFQNCIPVLNEINKLLAPNGILAFSTPSFTGISSRKSLRKFLQNSPADHYTIWSPKACKKALALAGFKVKKIVNCGHHPERFPVIGKLACCHWLLLIISKLFRLGDTFEVYALKI